MNSLNNAAVGNLNSTTSSVPTTPDSSFNTPSTTNTSSDIYTASSSQNNPTVSNNTVGSTGTSSEIYTASGSQSNSSSSANSVGSMNPLNNAAVGNVNSTTSTIPTTPSSTTTSSAVYTTNGSQSIPTGSANTVGRTITFSNTAVPNQTSTTSYPTPTTANRSIITPSSTTTSSKVYNTNSSQRISTGSANTVNDAISRRLNAPRIAPSRLPASTVNPVQSALTINNSSSNQKLKYPQQSISNNNAVARKLGMAKRETQTTPSILSTQRNSQNTIALLRQEKIRQKLLQRSNVSKPVRTQSSQLNQNQPTLSSRVPASTVNTVNYTSVAANSSSTQEVNYLEQSINDANAIARGLVVAKHEGKILPHTRAWRKTQDAIILLRQGKTRQEAADKSQVPMAILTQLIEWGQNRTNPQSVQSLQESKQPNEPLR